MQDETNIPSEEILDTEVPAEVVTPSDAPIEVEADEIADEEDIDGGELE